MRGEAWAIRVLAQAASIAPVDDIEQPYIHEKILNNITAWEAETSAPDHHPLHTWGHISCWGEDGGRPTSSIIGCEGTGYRTGVGSSANMRIKPIRHTSLPWQDDWMVLSLCHMKELGYDTQQLLSWLGEFTINRFSHPDASLFDGADYKYPSTYVENVATLNPYKNVTTWKQAADSFIEKRTEFVEDNDASYPRKAYAALSCLTDVTFRQISSDGNVDRRVNGQMVYDWLGDQFDNNNDVWSDGPNWAIIPRIEVTPECGNGICETGESGTCLNDCPEIKVTVVGGGSIFTHLPAILGRTKKQ